MRNFIFSIVAILLFSLMPSQSVRAETAQDTKHQVAIKCFKDYVFSLLYITNVDGGGFAIVAAERKFQINTDLIQKYYSL